MYSNRLGKGTHKAVGRLQSFITYRSQVHSIGNDGWFLQLDIANFFNHIDKAVLFDLLQQRLRKTLKQKTYAKQALLLSQDEALLLRWLCHAQAWYDPA